MFKIKRILFFILLFLSAAIYAQENGSINLKNHSTSKIGFLENRGQLKSFSKDKKVLWYANHKGLSISITNEGLSYCLHKTVFESDSQTKNNTVKELKSQDLKHAIDSCIQIDVQFLDSKINLFNIKPLNQNGDESVNIFNENAPNGIYGLHYFSTLQVSNIYKGVDLILQISDTGFKYSFKVQPGINPSIIKMRYTGQDDISIDSKGQLNLFNPIANFKEMPPQCFQFEEKIPSSFTINSEKIIQFNIPNYNTKKELIIDPTLVWATYWGGVSNYEGLSATDIDKFSNQFLTGYSWTGSYPLYSSGGYMSANNNSDIIITKLDKKQRVLWSTYFGGNGYDYGNAIKTDTNGNIFVTGQTTSSIFPLKKNGGYYDSTNSPNNYQDVFMLKFSNSGVLLWSTFLGGYSEDVGNDLTVDQSNNVIVIGTTYSLDFPKLFPAGCFSDSINYGISAFITKFNNNGSMLWSSLFGLTASTEGKTLSADKNNNFIIAGNSAGNNGSNISTVNNGGYFLANSSTISQDNFIAEFDQNCQLKWATNFGGNGNDNIYSSVIDNNNNVYLIGNTNSTNLPVKAFNSTCYLDTVLNGNSNTLKTDLFIVKFNSLHQLKWCTLLGGNNNEGDNYSTLYYPKYNYSPRYNFSNDIIKTDECNNVYVSMETYSHDLPLKEYDCQKYFDNTFSGVYDNALFMFDKNANLKWGTYVNVLSESIDTNNLIFGKRLPIRLGLNAANNLLTAQSFDGDLSVIGSNSLIAPLSSSYFNGGYAQNFLMNFIQPIQSPKFNTSLCNSGCTGHASVFNLQACNSNIVPSYIWSNSDTGKVATNLCAGTNYLVISDTAFFCYSDTFYFKLDSGIKVTPVQSKMSCPALCNGVYSIQIPGVTPTAITWYARDTVFTNITTLSHLCYGLDTVIVDVAGCGSDTTIFTNQQLPYLTLQLNSISSNFLKSCKNNCENSAEVLVFGGNGPKRIWWSNGDTGRIGHHLCIDSTYTVYATDSSCYTSKLDVRIKVPQTSTYVNSQYSYTVSCLPTNFCATQFYLNNVDVTTKMKYMWNTGDTTSTIINKPPGAYTCHIYNDCFSKNVNFYLNYYRPYFRYYTPCTLHNSTIYTLYVYAYGNLIPPFDWYLNGVLQAGKTNVQYPIFHNINLLHDTISLVTTCDTFTAKIIDNYSLQLDEDYRYEKQACNCNGASLVHAYGTPPVIVNWYKQFTNNLVYRDTCSGSKYSSYATNLCIGNYTVIGVDSCGNIDSITVKVIGYGTPYIQGVTTTPSCNGYCFGTANVSVSTNSVNGYSVHAYPYTFNWDSGAVVHILYRNNDNIAGLCSGSHNLTVTDACGNSYSYNFNIANAIINPVLNLGTTASCDSQCNGLAYIYVTNGFGPYSISWDGVQTNFNVQNFACANHTYNVSVTNSCGFTSTDSITVPSIPDISMSIIFDSLGCKGDCISKAHVEYTGGKPPYSIEWSNGTLYSASVSNLCTDSSYFCLVSSLGCNAKVKYFKVPLAPRPNAVLLYNNMSCLGLCTGYAKVDCISGVPPFAYLWDNGDTSSIADSLCVGVHNCIVTDKCGQKDTVTFTTQNSNIPLVSSLADITKTCDTLCIGSATVNHSGGGLPISYLWSNSAITKTTSNLCGGNNYCILTDACLFKDTLTFTTPNNFSSSSTVNSTICGNYFYTLKNNKLVNKTGIYTDTFKNWLGCDSFSIINLTVKPIDTINYNITLCYGKTYKLIDGKVISNQGNYYCFYKNKFNCDSFYTYKVKLIYNTYSYINITKCSADTFIAPSGKKITASGSINDTISNHSGCDSIINFNINNVNSPTINYSFTSCKNQLITLPNGVIATSSKKYYYNIHATAGCDTNVICTVTYTDSNLIILKPTICSNQQYILPDGQSVNTTGLYVKKYTNHLGCDSTIKVFLTVNPISTTILNVSICKNHPYKFNSKLLTTSSTYYDTLKNIFGCDSMVQLNLKVNPIYLINLTRTICIGDTIKIGTHKHFASGNYIDTLFSRFNCDSVIMLALTVMAPQKTFHFYTCANVPYKLPNGKIATLAGNYFDTIKNNSIAGCDTLITYIVSHIPISSKNLIVSICSNQYYKMPTGRLINQPGIYYDTLNNFVGCDSIIKVNLKVLPISFKNITDTICKNKPYFFNNNYLSNSGIYFDTLINYLLCDSVIQLNLNVNPNILTNKDYIICQGDSLQIGKHFYTTTNTYYDTLESITTCDTFAITNLNVIEPQVFLQAFPDSLINLGDNVNISALFKYTTDSILQWKSNLNFTTLDFKTIQIKPEEFSTWVYINTITKDGCKASDSLHISITNITLPNAFTPNGDGDNDVFIIRGTGLKFVTSFKIFNRWGEVVFITHDGNLGWDGNYKGVPQEVGTYIYNVQATFTNGVQKSLKGSLELIR